ncbi:MULTISPECIES: diaminopimelate decarboxylase [Sphingobacterium]|jgi:diaminopimelate decarboxylase|uniref:Diaminopimelate decarboxylase n=3 Tax=Sphingobacterium TaxID=28453 RepID=A0ACD5C5Z7_9SPHI|nr:MULTISPECIES: diaminopimelate decarboxylase [Sphingobacterium]HAE68164.1 diaminopimelate decarboxylase [Sphingobacterium sp.]MDF2853799.1 diaminopimelate decarboxylase [Sphingobacterium multivorum]OFV09881.1 diaminopimelate decarboxylase [Sphingobacterium sp. HMSC13C05]QQT45186.1 diaminopimelate decarboxylase [Sphingobacterium multivorum]QQT62176.1 diaminopimelate decarboxylase [Sphingobacterium multivorum]
MINTGIAAKFAEKETPFYYYDLHVLNKTLEAAHAASHKRGFHVHYALKANFNDELLKAIQAVGFGADCVSGNEVKKAIECGFDSKKVTFAGVGKSDKEINYALDQNIFAFNVESIQELEVINELASKKGVKANVALRINPNVDAHTHHYITTGLDENKFGVPNADLEKCAAVLKKCESIELVGLHFHVGSQITDMTVFKSLCVKVNEWKNWFEERGTQIRVLNVGGGLGIDYKNPDGNTIPDFEAYFDIFDRFLERTAQQEVHFELGRALVAQCGSLVSRVLYVKNGVKKNFLVLDAGMTELMRPALYQAYHKIENISAVDTVESINYDVVGPICESSDCFGKEVPLPVSKRGDLIAIRSAGAYGEVMASRYNLREEIRFVYSNQL